MSKNLIKVLLLVASFALYYVVIRPLYTGAGGIMQPEMSIERLKLLNTQYDDTLSQAENLISQAQAMRTQYAQIKDEDKARMKIMVPDSIDKVRLLSEVTGIAEDAGFALNELTYSEGSNSLTTASKASVFISFSVKTTYPRFKALMNNFEKSMRLYSVNSILFTTPNKEGDLTTYQVKLETYYMK